MGNGYIYVIPNNEQQTNPDSDDTIDSAFQTRSAECIEPLSFDSIELVEMTIPLHAGHMLMDSAAGHPTCGGSYFDVLESGLNVHGINSVIISSDRATIPIKA